MRKVFAILLFFVFSGCAGSQIDKVAAQANLENIELMESELDDYYADDEAYNHYDLEYGQVSPVLQAKRLHNRQAVKLARAICEEATSDED